MHLLHVKSGNVITHRVPVQIVGNRSASVSAHQPASWTTVISRSVAGAFGFVWSLTHDSRALVNSTDELAAAAVTWEANSRSRAILARHIETAQIRSQAGLPGMANAALARPAMFTPGTLFSQPRSAPYRG